jgi:hypothetical protein
MLDISGIVGKIQSGTDAYFHNDSLGGREHLLSEFAYVLVSTREIEQAG